MKIEGGREWKPKESGVPGWSSLDGKFDILQGAGKVVVLVAFDHDPIDDACEFWRRRFPSLKEAMEYAERM